MTPAGREASARTVSTRSVPLERGGSVKLTIEADVLGLTPRERQFVFALVDILVQYQGEVGSAAAGPASVDDAVTRAAVQAGFELGRRTP